MNFVVKNITAILFYSGLITILSVKYGPIGFGSGLIISAVLIATAQQVWP